MARRFYVRTFGCQMNAHDSERIAGLLASEGMEPTEDVEDADVVVLNTCCIREHADERLYGHLGALKSLKARRPSMQIAVAGCLAQKDRAGILERAPHVDVVVGTFNVARTAALLRDAVDGPQVEVWEAPTDSAPTPFLWPTALPAARRRRHAAWVTIQIGCDNSCSFCIVPAVRGPEVSRPFGEILAEVESLAAQGVFEVTLLGQNVNSYGRDLTLGLRAGAAPSGPAGRLDPTYGAGEAWVREGGRRVRPLFADLLRAVGGVPGIRRVRFTSPHPKDLRPETIAAMAETEAVCEQLHLPLQSGSDRILAAMRRGYRAETYLARLEAARRAVPDLAVTTDIIVGFPGETEADFEETLRVVAEAGYDSAYTFIFSPRPGTRAAALSEEAVPAPVIAERFARLKEVVDRSALLRHRARVGRVEEVVVEGPHARDASLVSGRTRQGKLVHFPLPSAVGGTTVRVRIEAAGAHHLEGVPVGVAEPPRRVPVAIGLSAG